MSEAALTDDGDVETRDTGLGVHFAERKYDSHFVSENEHLGKVATSRWA